MISSRAARDGRVRRGQRCQRLVQQVQRRASPFFWREQQPVAYSPGRRVRAAPDASACRCRSPRASSSARSSSACSGTSRVGLLVRDRDFSNTARVRSTRQSSGLHVAVALGRTSWSLKVTPRQHVEHRVPCRSAALAARTVAVSPENDRATKVATSRWPGCRCKSRQVMDHAVLSVAHIAAAKWPLVSP